MERGNDKVLEKTLNYALNQLNQSQILKEYMEEEIKEKLNQIDGSNPIESLDEIKEELEEIANQYEILDKNEAVNYLEKYDKSLENSLNLAKEIGILNQNLTVNELATVYARNRMAEEIAELSSFIKSETTKRDIDPLTPDGEKKLIELVKEEFNNPEKYSHLKNFTEIDEIIENLKEAIEEVKQNKEEELKMLEEGYYDIEFGLNDAVANHFEEKMIDNVVNGVEFYYPDEAFNYLKEKMEENPEYWNNPFDQALLDGLHYENWYKEMKPLTIETLATLDLQNRLKEEIGELIENTKDFYLENKEKLNQELNQDITKDNKLTMDNTIQNFRKPKP
jgi:hypothetical protein